MILGVVVSSLLPRAVVSFCWHLGSFSDPGLLQENGVVSSGGR